MTEIRIRGRFVMELDSSSRHVPDFAGDVLRGLSARPKRLEPIYFYDDAGSRLFEEICDLPEYYLTRTERSLIERRAGEIAEAMDGSGEPLCLLELGSGNSAKTRLLIEAFLARRPDLTYMPVDISHSALSTAGRNLARDFDGLSVRAVASEYGHGLQRLEGWSGRRLVCFLGSNLGNMSPDDALTFLQGIRGRLREGDALLLGLDLKKDAKVLENAYNDRRGVTARFNLNVLERINRELGGRFDTARFRHRAVFREAEERVEMHLESLGDADVEVTGLGRSFPFRKGETIHTENSYKYSLGRISSLAAAAGLRVDMAWTDPRRYFSLNLLRPATKSPVAADGPTDHQGDIK